MEKTILHTCFYHLPLGEKYRLGISKKESDFKILKPPSLKEILAKAVVRCSCRGSP